MLKLLRQLDEMRTACWYFVVNGDMIRVLCILLFIFSLLFVIASLYKRSKHIVSIVSATIMSSLFFVGIFAVPVCEKAATMYCFVHSMKIKIIPSFRTKEDKRAVDMAIAYLSSKLTSQEIMQLNQEIKKDPEIKMLLEGSENVK